MFAVTATDASNATATIDVTLNVINVDEDGSLTLSSTQPQVDAVLTADLGDIDGGVTSITWKWEKSGSSHLSGERGVRMRGGEGCSGQVTPLVWSRTRCR